MAKQSSLDDYKERLVEMINSGCTSTQMSEEFGVSNACICRWRKRLGMRPQYRTPEELVEQIAHMYLDENMPRKEIAKILGVKLCTVTNTIMAKGLTRNSVDCQIDKNIDKVRLVKVEDPVYYIEHRPTLAKCSYHGKQYRDMTAGILGG